MAMDHLFVKLVRKCTGVGKYYRTTSNKQISRKCLSSEKVPLASNCYEEEVGCERGGEVFNGQRFKPNNLLGGLLSNHRK